jgi:hypothetical protein
MVLQACRQRSFVALLVGAAALAPSAVALADNEQIQLTGAGNAAARAAVLGRADIGGTGWTGGAKKPDLTSTLPCSYQPKQSDLVLIGAAETTWTNTGIVIDSSAQVLRTPAMVMLDWQRSVLAPQVMPCVRAELSQQIGSAGDVVSFSRIAFPAIATYTRAFRALIDVKASSTTLRMMADVVLFGRGRTEVTLTTVAPYSIHAAVGAAELRLARLLVSRVRS